ncbi:hypothetical protein EDB85DRAFT_1325363 [Lactarius pseudohatsudake]|nr:hypothetical protein EDB85DRAFT_1325363 [Lactarius pseudohatsudake]
MSQFHLLPGPLALALVMAGTSLHMEVLSMQTEQANSGRFRGDSWRSEPTYRPRDPNADHYEPDYGDERPRSDGEQATPSLKHMILLTYGRGAISWQRGCLSHLTPGNMATYLTRNSIWLRDLGEPRGRMPPPREDYAYPYSGDSYRAGTSLHV